jgi:NAD(P)-dependent dehydrogenase (short-subunit alcohol dehydrogenase family)
MARLRERVAVVTGAAGAIGSATCRRLVSEGAAVALLDLPTSQGEALGAELRAGGGKALFIPTDVSEEAQVSAAVQMAAAQVGRPTLLATIAAINLNGQIDQLSVETWDRMMAVNVRGVFLALKHTVPHLKAAGGGAVVNMCSVSAFIGSTDSAPYVTTRGAIFGLTRSLAQELAPHGIRVNSVAPGWVDTPFTDAYIEKSPDPAALRAYANGLHAMGRMATPDEVAKAVTFLLSDDSSFTTGSELFVDGGFMIKR